MLDESQGLLEEGTLSRYSVTALCVRCLTVCVPGLGLPFPTHHSPSFSVFFPLPYLSHCPLIGFILSGVDTNTKCHYLFSLCGTHVISSEPHGAMVSIHVSGFFSLLKLEFLSGVPISGAEESGLACANQKTIADIL